MMRLDRARGAVSRLQWFPAGSDMVSEMAFTLKDLNVKLFTDGADKT
jgi:hypothetical protein